MINLEKNRPSPQGLRIIELCHLHPASSVQQLAKLMGLSEIETMVIISRQRKNRNLNSAKDAMGNNLRGRYVATPKGRGVIGVPEPEPKAKAEVKVFKYTRLQTIEMTSHRPGAWDANAIARRGLAC